MPIRRPNGSSLGVLIAALSSSDSVQRESAIARLTVLGSRGFDRLAAVHADPNTSREVQTAILRVFEGTGDSRALGPAQRSLAAGGDVAVAAVGTLRALLAADADASASALDALMVVAKDAAADRRVRAAALEALHELPADDRARLQFALDSASMPAPRPARRPRARWADAVWTDAVEGKLPDEPATLRAAAAQHAATAPLGSLQKLIDAVRRREDQDVRPQRAGEWRALRGTLHQTLAMRGSRVALYDLRETAASTSTPLAPSYIAALQAIGDLSCLEAMARAFAATPPNSPAAYQLANALKTVLGRQPRARARTALDRIAARWPDAAAVLSTPSRTTVRRKPRART